MSAGLCKYSNSNAEYPVDCKGTEGGHVSYMKVQDVWLSLVRGCDCCC